MTNTQHALLKTIKLLDHESPDCDAALELLQEISSELEGKLIVDFDLLCDAISDPYDDTKRHNLGESLRYCLDDREDYRKMSKAFQDNMKRMKNDNS